jgi:hypothetical protein
MLGITGDINQAKSIFTTAQELSNSGMERARVLRDFAKQHGTEAAGLRRASRDFSRQLQGQIKEANVRSAQGGKTVIEPEVFAEQTRAKKAADAAKLARDTARTQADEVAKVAAGQVAQEAKAAQVLKDAKNVAKTPLNRLAAAIAPTVKATGPGLLRRGTGMVMRKLGPIIDAVNTTRYAYNKITGDEEQEAALNARAKELLDKGDLGGAGSVYNLMPATVAGGGRTAFEADARIKAKDMAVDEWDKRAAAGDKEVLQALSHERRRKQALTEAGHTTETLKALPLKERLAIMKKARDQARR